MEKYKKEASRIVDLQRRYGGRISANVSGDDAIEMAVIVAELMAEWNPINASISALKAIMGTPTKEEPRVLEYVFDEGLNGNLWRFTILGDIIVGVEWVPLD